MPVGVWNGRTAVQRQQAHFLWWHGFKQLRRTADLAADGDSVKDVTVKPNPRMI